MKKYFAVILFSLYIFAACRHQPQTPIDKYLFEEAKKTTEYKYFLDSLGKLESKGNSPHGSFVKVKFNSIAQTVLGTDGKLSVGAEFPDSSIVVKEVYSSKNSDVSVYAVMMKLKNNASSAKGWLWGEYSSSGSVKYSVRDQGSACTSCHSQQGNRDYVDIFYLH